jgi:hypothetical protein
MAIHGVDESGPATLSNMKFLHQELAKADKVISY